MEIRTEHRGSDYMAYVVGRSHIYAIGITPELAEERLEEVLKRDQVRKYESLLFAVFVMLCGVMIIVVAIVLGHLCNSSTMC